VDDIEQAGPPADLVEAYCAVLPVRVICALLGLPIDDIPQFQVWSDAFALATPITPEARTQRMKEFEVYIARLIAHRRAEPGQDLIDDLVAARDGGDRLTESELPYLVMALIVGGTHTTSNVLGRSVLELLRDNAMLWRGIVFDSTLIPSAVDELLRFNVLGDLLQLRVAVDDVELPSGTVRKGDAVVVAVRSAMTDESVYEDPLTVRFDRAIREPLYFGGGPHFCIGSHLAKAELQVGIQVLAQHLPGLSLAVGLDELHFTEGAELSSLVSLPVRW
jgi:cytochrome P450